LFNRYRCIYIFLIDLSVELITNKLTTVVSTVLYRYTHLSGWQGQLFNIGQYETGLSCTVVDKGFQLSAKRLSSK